MRIARLTLTHTLCIVLFAAGCSSDSGTAQDGGALDAAGDTGSTDQRIADSSPPGDGDPVKEQGVDSGPAAPLHPLMREFMGLNGHTVQFKPTLYKSAALQARDYHNLSWDVGTDTSAKTTFPLAANKVNWKSVYGSWVNEGYTIDVSVQFSGIAPGDWKNLPVDAKAYGQAFASYFGPSGAEKLVASVEIGNEPGSYDDATYRTLFSNMAQGLKAGDAAIKVVTCAIEPGPSHAYAKSVDTVKGLEQWYDVLNIHSYAQVEGWPTWKRSFPEDPTIDYLTRIQKLIDWRDNNAPGKAIWVTEFGWDACTKPAPATGTFKDWVDVSDTQQAQYLVRSFLVFSAMDLGRAFIYFFNDADQPSVHASSGLTRDFVPKPSYHAVSHQLATLGDYRFTRVVSKKDGGLYDYEFSHDSDAKKRVRVVWLASGSGSKASQTINVGAATVGKAEGMPLAASGASPVAWQQGAGGAITLEVSESPTYLWLTLP